MGQRATSTLGSIKNQMKITRVVLKILPWGRGEKCREFYIDNEDQTRNLHFGQGGIFSL